MYPKRRISLFYFSFFAVIGPASATAEPTLRFEVPVDCKVGTNCFVQTLVDHDAGPGASDFMCGQLTYDGHNGTDFRVPDLPSTKTVDVLAAADGRVLRARNNMEDISVRRIGVNAVKGKECGNALAIGHGSDWETQYCHLAKDSLVVRPGDHVAAGQPIAKIGLSGLTEFPHLHFTVRHRSKVVDPFAFGQENGQCGAGQRLWRDEAASQLAYRPGFLINTGFASRSLDTAAIDAGALSSFVLKEDSPALLAAARSGGLVQGDIVQLALTGPDGAVLAKKTGEPLAKGMAQHLMMIGKLRPASGWPRGHYSAAYKLIRNGQSLIEREFELAY